MPLTNAERQARFRERRDRAAATGGLTSEQASARDAVMAEPIYPVPPLGERDAMPKFMGWERYEWSAAPRELAEHFGMGAAWDGWREEHDALKRLMRYSGPVDQQR